MTDPISPPSPRAPTRRDIVAGAIGAAGAGLAGWLLPPRAGQVKDFLAGNPSFLADNPDLVTAAAAVADTRAGEKEADRRRELIENMRVGLLNPLAAPCLGPLQGRLGLVEITDYLCAPCRGSSGPVETALAAHPESNALLLLVPISGALSDYIAGFAAAAYFTRPGSFAALHRALMEGGMPDQARVESIAASLGHDVAAVARDADSVRVRAYLAAARRFAEDIGLTGVPAFLNARGRMQLGGITAQKARELIGQA